ncbi:MAG: restriction endonuclease [Deltaproteobacteria bacterium]|nr:restriction endonuclease [Deltaproteobacteria bacterium]
MIPKFQKIMLPQLKLLSDGKEYGISEIHDELAKSFELSDEELKEYLPSGKQTTFKNRVAWARTYMKKAGLLESSKKAHFIISSRGLELIREKPEEINSKFLTRYEEFREFRKPKNKIENDVIDEISEIKDQTPQENIEYAYQKINSDLANELLNTIKSCSPDFFEQLVIDVLIGMGYGGSRKEAGKAVGKSNDGGIDGIINEDILGLDVIYIQAKRWGNTVPIKEIRDFTGALASKRAKKGVFITTSNFPKSAYEFVEQIEYKIILIDGERLANLMIEYNIGTSTREVHYIKEIDTDYFVEN